MLDPQPAQDQRPPLAQPMRVVPDPNPHVKQTPSSGDDHVPAADRYSAPAKIVSFSPQHAYPDRRHPCQFRSH